MRPQETQNKEFISIELLHRMYEQANKIGQCGMLFGSETLSDLVRKLYSPQGSEFCRKHQFPSATTFEAIEREVGDLTKYGIYVNRGLISEDIVDEKNIWLIGDTVANVVCTKTAIYHINMMQGAKATVSAGGYAVVSLKAAKDCTIHLNQEDKAVINIHKEKKL